MTKKEKVRRILRQLNHEADGQEKHEFGQWLLDKPENLDLYGELKDIWELPIQKNVKFDSQCAEKRINNVLKKDKIKRLAIKYFSRIAASALILLSVGTYAYYYLTNNQLMPDKTIVMSRQITKTSGAGEQLRISLPDGSTVLLNSGSSIQFPEKFTGNSRPVQLHGEAFFEVTKDPAHPFTVTSGNVTTTVWGTSFNIKAFEKANVAVTVATGKVKVECQSGNKSSGLLLYPNQRATYDSDRNKLQLNEVNAKDFYSWTDGVLRFNGDSFDEVIKMLERWYKVQIKLEVKVSPDIEVNGIYKDKKLYTILDGLSFMYNLNYRYVNDSLIVLTSK